MNTSSKYKAHEAGSPKISPPKVSPFNDSVTDVLEAYRTFFLPCEVPALSGKHYRLQTTSMIPSPDLTLTSPEAVRAAHTGPGCLSQRPPPRARIPSWKSGPPSKRTSEPEGFFQQGRKGLVTQKLRQTQMRKLVERSEITGNLLIRVPFISV